MKIDQDFLTELIETFIYYNKIRGVFDSTVFFRKSNSCIVSHFHGICLCNTSFKKQSNVLFWLSIICFNTIHYLTVFFLQSELVSRCHSLLHIYRSIVINKMYLQCSRNRWRKKKEVKKTLYVLFTIEIRIRFQTIIYTYRCLLINYDYNKI